MQLLRLELGQGSWKENWPQGGVLGRSVNVTRNNEGYKETVTWTRLLSFSRLKTRLSPVAVWVNSEEHQKGRESIDVSQTSQQMQEGSCRQNGL